MKKVLLFLFLGFISFGYGQKHTTLSGQIKNLRKDTIEIVLQINDIVRQSKSIFVPITNGKFKEEIYITNPTYLYIKDGVNYINGLLEPGDSTSVIYDVNEISQSLRFEGKGKEKFSLINSFTQFKLNKKIQDQVPIARQKKYPFDQMFNFIDSVGTNYLNLLESIKPSISIESFYFIQADIKGRIMESKYSSIGLIYHEGLFETVQKRQNELTNESKKVLSNILKFDDSLINSTFYVNAVYNVLFIEYSDLVLSNRINRSIIKKYDYLNSQLPSKLKIPVLTLFLEHDINKLNQGEDIETLIKQTYESAVDDPYKKYITKLYNEVTSFKRGGIAPEFDLENEKGEKITLASFKGKVVYVDFWFAACAPCHALFQTIKPVKKHYANNKSVVFLCISVDSKEVWKSSLAKYKIDGYHVYTKNLEMNHPVIKAYKVSGYPTSCIIDKNGKMFIATPSSNSKELQNEIEEALKINLQ